MCHVFQETGSQPVEDDVPLHVGDVLKAFPDAEVVSEAFKDAVVTGVGVVKDGKHIPSKEFFKKDSKAIMEEFFGKL